MKRSGVRRAAALLVAVAMTLPGASARADDLLVFAAAALAPPSGGAPPVPGPRAAAGPGGLSGSPPARLGTPSEEGKPRFDGEKNLKVVASTAARSPLARQIEPAAPADVYISADL